MKNHIVKEPIKNSQTQGSWIGTRSNILYGFTDDRSMTILKNGWASDHYIMDAIHVYADINGLRLWNGSFSHPFITFICDYSEYSWDSYPKYISKHIIQTIHNFASKQVHRATLFQ